MNILTQKQCADILDKNTYANEHGTIDEWDARIWYALTRTNMLHAPNLDLHQFARMVVACMISYDMLVRTDMNEYAVNTQA